MFVCSFYSVPCITLLCRKWTPLLRVSYYCFPVGLILHLSYSDYAAKVFGFATFGTVYGTIICLSGLCTFAQSALQAITHDAFHGNPTPVNLALAGLGVIIGIALVTFVTLKGRTVQQEQADEDERRSLLPRPSPAGLRALSTVQETTER